MHSWQTKFTFYEDLHKILGKIIFQLIVIHSLPYFVGGEIQLYVCLNACSTRETLYCDSFTEALYHPNTMRLRVFGVYLILHAIHNSLKTLFVNYSTLNYCLSPVTGHIAVV